MKLIDIILLPRSFYQKFSEKRPALIAGIVLVGIIDMAYLFYENYSRIFMAKSGAALYYNITLAILLTVLTGFVDVLFFSMPLIDMIYLVHRRSALNINRMSALTRFMKVYVVSNVLILPASLIYYILLKNYVVSEYTAGLFYALISIWLSCAVMRGADVIYRFEQRHRAIVFAAIYSWSHILSYVLGYLIARWGLVLFR